jgi:hypothetical protein
MSVADRCGSDDDGPNVRALKKLLLLKLRLDAVMACLDMSGSRLSRLRSDSEASDKPRRDPAVLVLGVELAGGKKFCRSSSEMIWWSAFLDRMLRIDPSKGSLCVMVAVDACRGRVGSAKTSDWSACSRMENAGCVECSLWAGVGARGDTCCVPTCVRTASVRTGFVLFSQTHCLRGWTSEFPTRTTASPSQSGEPSGAVNNTGNGADMCSGDVLVMLDEKRGKMRNLLSTAVILLFTFGAI